MSISSPFIKRPIATSLLMFAILLSGMLTYKLLPISSLPEVDYPTIQVSTFYPGANPQVMATSITSPLERQFGQMPGLNQMTSISSSGSSVITLQFTLDMNLDVAEQEVQAAINAGSGFLPLGLPNPPVYSKVNPADTPIITLAITSDTLPLSQVEDFAETRIAQKISQLSGVGLVSISGGQRPAVRIQVNSVALASYGLTMETIRSAVQNANVNGAKGSFDGTELAYTINANDQLLNSAQYANIIIAYKNNAPVRLSDVATVIDDVENSKQAAWVNSKPAIILNVQRQPGANVIKVADSIKNLLPVLSAAIPSSVDIQILSDRTITIRDSVSDVQFELILAVFLVVVVIFVFLRNFSATIIPSIAVPLSLVGTFGAMYLFGFSLNNFTLMALTIATGFVVDDAIVMIENITRYIEEGEDPMKAAYKGSDQIGFTILSLTVSLIAVLIPLLFMQDVIGRLFREFALTLAITILISAFVSLTLTPMLCSRVLKHRTEKEMSQFEIKAGAVIDKIINNYDNSLQVVLRHQPLTLAVTIATLFMTFFLIFAIPKGFFPAQDTGVIQGVSEAPQKSSFLAMANSQQELVKIVLQDPAVENISSFIGIDGTNTTLNTGRMLIVLKPLEDRKASATEVTKRLQVSLKDSFDSLYLQPVQDLTIDDRVSRTQYQFSLSSPDSEELSNYTKLLLDKLQDRAELANVVSDQQTQGLQTFVNVNRDTASQLGISMQNIDDSLYDMFGQRQISTIFTERNQYHVILEALPELQKGSKAINNVYLATTSGNPTPLNAIATISEQFAALSITRQNQFPVTTISFDLAPSTSLGKAVSAIEEVKAELKIPAHIISGFQGTAKVFEESLNNEGWLIAAAIIVVYIVLGVLYESYIHPITILSTLPSACMGALFSLMITGHDLNIIALIGIILLIGIVMKNAIMMVDFALEQERVYKKEPEPAIHQACLLRFRPILMTTLAAMFGAVPLILGLGMGSELRQPLGVAIIGGLIVSQVLTLYSTPVIYLAFDRLSRSFVAWRIRKFGSEDGEANEVVA